MKRAGSSLETNRDLQPTLHFPLASWSVLVSSTSLFRFYTLKSWLFSVSTLGPAAERRHLFLSKRKPKCELLASILMIPLLPWVLDVSSILGNLGEFLPQEWNRKFIMIMLVVFLTELFIYVFTRPNKLKELVEHSKLAANRHISQLRKSYGARCRSFGGIPEGSEEVFLVRYLKKICLHPTSTRSGDNDIFYDPSTALMLYKPFVINFTLPP